MIRINKHNRPLIPIYVFDESGAFVTKYESMTECSDKEGVSCSVISVNCKKNSFNKKTGRYYRKEATFQQ